MSLAQGALANGAAHSSVYAGQITSRLERRNRSRRADDSEWCALASVAGWLIEREPLASIILDRKLRVLLANAAAQDLLQRTRQIEMRGATLCFTSKAHRAVVTAVVAEQTSHSTFQIRIEGKPETARIEAIRFVRPTNGYFILTVARPASGLIGKLRSRLRLTAAESEVALAIARGLPQRQIARQRRASINTIKTQVRCIYLKAGVRSQAALASKVAEIR